MDTTIILVSFISVIVGMIIGAALALIGVKRGLSK
jgi:hypothetical protein